MEATMSMSMSHINSVTERISDQCSARSEVAHDRSVYTLVDLGGGVKARLGWSSGCEDHGFGYGIY